VLTQILEFTLGWILNILVRQSNPNSRLEVSASEISDEGQKLEIYSWQALRRLECMVGMFWAVMGFAITPRFFEPKAYTQ